MRNKTAGLQPPPGTKPYVTNGAGAIYLAATRYYCLPAPKAYLRLQELHRRAEGASGPFQNKGISGLSAGQARRAYLRALCMALGQFVAVPRPVRLTLFRQLLNYASSKKSVDGLESLYLSGLSCAQTSGPITGVTFGAAQILNSAGSAVWTSIGAPSTLGGGLGVAPIYNSSTGYVSVQNLAGVQGLPVTDGILNLTGLASGGSSSLDDSGFTTGAAATIGVGGAAGGMVIGLIQAASDDSDASCFNWCSTPGGNPSGTDAGATMCVADCKGSPTPSTGPTLEEEFWNWVTGFVPGQSGGSTTPNPDSDGGSDGPSFSTSMPAGSGSSGVLGYTGGNSFSIAGMPSLSSGGGFVPPGLGPDTF